MSRIRSIKPEYWTDEKVVAMSPLARLLFIGIWNFVDDEGRGEYSPLRLKMQILPADSTDASELLGEIRRAGMIDVYEVDGKEFFQVRNFAKHQKIDKRATSKFPAPPSSPPIPPESPRLPPNPHPGMERERERERKGSSEPNGSGAVAPASENLALPAKAPDAELFRVGREVLGKSAGGVITDLRKSLKYDDVRTLEVVREAAGKDRPMEWIQGVLRGDTTARTSEREWAKVYRGVEV